MSPHKVLPEHKRTKKKLVAPMNHLLQDHGWTVHPQWVSHERVIVPEVLWLAYLDEHFGHNRASDLITFVMTSASEAEPSVHVNGYASSFSRLNEPATERLRSSLVAKGVLRDLRSVVGGLCYLFPAFPLRNLLGPSEPDIAEEVTKLKKMIETLNDRIGITTTYTLGHLFYGSVMAGHFKINADSSLANPLPITSYPDTEESQLFAASLRMNSKMMDSEITTKDPFGWQRAFWRTCLELEPPKL